MNYTIIFYCALALLVSGPNGMHASAVTYELNGGRFGDQVITYAKAKWIAFKHRLPFFYIPFSYSDQLELDSFEQRLTSTVASKYRRFDLANDQQIDPNLTKNKLYYLGYETRLSDWNNWEYNMFPKVYNASYIQELRRCIKPKNPVAKLPIPDGALSVALHVRKGGGFDLPLLTEQQAVTGPIDKRHYVDIDFPLKFPPDEYYIEQLKKLSEMFNDVLLYVYIFTDDKNPARLAMKYAEKVGKSNIIFDYRRQGNAHNAHVIEDFFGMMQCDCLIRSDSSFSRAAHLVGDFKVVIYPKSFIWSGHKLIINEVVVALGEKS